MLVSHSETRSGTSRGSSDISPAGSASASGSFHWRLGFLPYSRCLSLPSSVKAAGLFFRETLH